MGKSTISTGPWLQVRELLVITKGCELSAFHPQNQDFPMQWMGGEGIGAQCSELAPPIE